jgi:hypothetical protein
MISYLDMTFCSHYVACADATGCPRCLTPEVVDAAIKWWGSDDAPISIYAEEPSCFREIKWQGT